MAWVLGSNPDEGQYLFNTLPHCYFIKKRTLGSNLNGGKYSIFFQKSETGIEIEDVRLVPVFDRHAVKMRETEGNRILTAKRDYSRWMGLCRPYWTPMCIVCVSREFPGISVPSLVPKQ